MKTNLFCFIIISLHQLKICSVNNIITGKNIINLKVTIKITFQYILRTY